MIPRSRTPRLLLGAAVAAVLLVASAMPARAALVVTVLGSSATPGGTGSFDVTLQNTGSTGVDIAGFQVELSVPGSSGILFTGATRGTSDLYIFDAAPGPDPLNNDPGNPFPNADFIGSDTYFAVPGYTTLGAGLTVGLMHVTYSVGASTPVGLVTVSILPYDPDTGGGTQLTDVETQPIEPLERVPGTIRVTDSTPGAVPEPSTLVLAGLGAGFLFLRHRRSVSSRRGTPRD